MTEEEIRARLTLDAEDYVREMKEAEKATKDFDKRTKDTGKSVERSLDGMKGKIGELVKATADGTGRIGEAVTALAKLDLALGMVGRVKDFASRIYDVSMAMARLADDAADTAAYLKRTFGSMANDAKVWASQTAKAYGAYSQEVQSFYTRLYETLTASGLARHMADEYAQELTRLRYDLSAVLKWYSEDQISQWITDVATKGNEEAFQKLMAGMTFEEAAKSAGVWSASMDQATKKATMAKLLMSEYSDEMGSWTANLNTASGAEARLSAAIDELQKNIGQVLSPVLAAAINMVSDLVDTFNGLAEAIGRITGASVIEVTSADLVKEVARSMGQLADATEEASEASAGLAGFDRLNRLADKSGEGEGKGMDFADGLDSWMRLWEMDAAAAETAADALWDAILDSGLKTEDEIRGRFGDLFGWMADQSDVEMTVRTEAVDAAWASLEKRIKQYQSAVKKARKQGLEDTSSIRQTYGTAIQAIFPKLADQLGVYSGKGVASASTSTAEELQRSMDDVVKAIEAIPVYSDTTFRAKVKTWLSANANKVEGAVDELPVGSDISAILDAFNRAGIDVSDASAVEAASQLATIGKAYQGSATLGGLLESLGGVEEAVEGIPAYSDKGLRSSLKSWLSSTSGKVEKAVKGLPHDADLEDVLAAFEKNGIDVSDPNAQAAAEALAGIGKAYEGGTTLGSIVEGLGGVEKAVGSVQPYDDADMRRSLYTWITNNSSAVRTAVEGLPTGSDVSEILSAFESAGIDVSDPSAKLAASALAGIGRSYDGTKLGSLVDSMGGVEAAIGDIPAYSDDALRRSLYTWLSSNATTVEAAVKGLPTGSDLTAILSAFEGAGIDVSDPNALAAANLLRSIGRSYDGTTLGAVLAGLGGVETAIGDIPAYDDAKLYRDAKGWMDENWTAIKGVLSGIPSGSSLSAILAAFKAGGFDVTDSAVALGVASLASSMEDTSGIEDAMKDAVKGLEVKAQTAVTVQEHDYSSVFDQMGKDIGGGLSDIGDAVGGLDIPDYSGVLDQMGKDLKDVKDDMSTVADNSTARTVPDAEKALRDAQAAAAEEIRRVTDRLSDPATWANPVELAGALGDTISTVVDSLTDTGSAEEALRQAQNEAAEKGLPDIATAMLAKLGNTDNREELREALTQGKSWYQLNQLYRNRAQQAGITSGEWANAVAAVKAMPTQTQTTAPTGSGYFAKQSSLGVNDPYGSVVSRYFEENRPWADIPQYVRDYYATFGIKGYAKGGVFEPNSPVLAVLGDNRRETEVAAPYSTIVKAVRDALSSATLSGAQAIELTANIQLDGRTVARTTLPYLVQESKRLGVSL